MSDVPSRVQADVRALTVKQPWCDLIMAGVKTVENRSRPVPSTLPQWHLCGCGHRIDPAEEHPYGDPRGHAVVRPDPWTGEPMRDACGPGEPDGPFPFRLFIHAAKEADHDNTNWETHWLPLNGQGERWLTNDRYGALLGSVTVTSQHHADECFATRDDLPGRTFVCDRFAEPDRWHIIFADPQPLAEPIPVRGQLGWWRLSDDLKAAIAEQEEA